MNRTWNLILGLALTAVLLTPLAVQAAIIYVDKDNPCPGTGTSQSPYCSIQNAVNVVNAGDTIRIRDSATAYNEAVTVTRTGTSGAGRITMEPDVGHNPVLSFSGGGNPLANLTLSGVNYWTVRNLRFQGDSSFSTMRALLIYNGAVTGNAVIGNTFQNWGGAESLNNSGSKVSYVLNISGGSAPCGGSPPHDNLIQGNTFSNNRLASIVLTCADDTIIENNDISGATCARDTDGAVNELGIKIVEGGSGTIIRNNTIHDFAPHSACGLTNQLYATYAAIWCDTSPSDGLVDSNLVYNIDQNKGNATNPLGYSQASYGIFMEMDCSNWTIQNNRVHHVGYAGMRNSPVYAITPNKWYNNTVYSMANWAMQNWFGYSIVRNNIFANTTNSPIHVDSQAVNQGNMTFSNNVYWHPGTSGGRVGDWGGSGNLSLSSWNASSGDTNSRSADPVLTDPANGDFHLSSSSPAINTGATLSAVTVDFEGTVRPQGTAYDIGAAEFDPVDGSVPNAPTNLRIVNPQ